MSIVNRSHGGTQKWKRAIVVTICLLLLSALTPGQTASNPNILIVPYGIWQVCESAWGAQTPLCSGFASGNEQFLLLIKATRPETTEYLYTIVATMQDGSTRAVSGQLKRTDNNAGYSSTSVYLGGVAISFNTTVEEATISATESGTGTFQP